MIGAPVFEYGYSLSFAAFRISGNYVTYFSVVCIQYMIRHSASIRNNNVSIKI